jgi:hypothetical protein
MSTSESYSSLMRDYYSLGSEIKNNLLYTKSVIPIGVDVTEHTCLG